VAAIGSARAASISRLDAGMHGPVATCGNRVIAAAARLVSGGAQINVGSIQSGNDCAGMRIISAYACFLVALIRPKISSSIAIWDHIPLFFLTNSLDGI